MRMMGPKASETPCTRRALGRRDAAIAGLLFAATLAVRLVFLFRSQDTAWPHSVAYEGDAPVWVHWAVLLTAGQPFEDDLPFRTPGVAFVLKWLGLVEPPFTWAKAIWCVLSAATPSALYLVIARWFGRVAAVVAATLTAVSFGSFVLATSLNNEVPYALLVTVAIGFTLRWVEHPRMRTSIPLGLLHGACMLLRAEHALLLAMLGAWSALATWHRGTKVPRAALQTAAVGVFAVLACLPWTLRSHAAVVKFNGSAPLLPYRSATPPWTPGAIDMFSALPGFAQGPNFAFLSDIAKREGWTQVDEVAVHQFFDGRWGSTPEPLPAWSLVSFKGPLDFALSNDPRSDGGFSRVGLADAESPDPAFSLARPSHARLVTRGYEVGWNSIRSDPARWRALLAEKMRRFMDGATLGLFPGDWPHAAPHIRQSVDMAVPMRGDAPTWNALMLAMMGVGVILATRLPGGGALICALAWRVIVIAAFYGYARHAVSIGPVLFAFIGIAVQWMAAWALTIGSLRNRAALARGVGVAMVAVLFTLAAFSAWNPPIWFGKPARLGGRITPTPHWHPDAFEAVDAIVIEPMPESAR